jgi:hypothetical protein
MAAATKTDQELRPKQAIRRFDVFAEVNRLKALSEGRPEDEAKGYGIWLAKVVAGRRFGRKGDGGERPPDRPERNEEARSRPEDKFRHAGDELQTDETFEREIVKRMGRDFYARVFSPAIHSAVDQGQRYEQFRDTIRSGWKPAR